MIKKNLDILEKEIQNICDRVGRNREEIEVVAVTKTVDLNLIEEAIDYKYNSIGENRVQELEKRFTQLEGKDVNYHMIGSLQSNKVKDIVGKVKLIHSVDRMSVVRQIQRRSKNKEIVTDVLLQVNIAEEDTKSGLKEEEVIPFIEKVIDNENMRIRGLMTMAPHVEDEEIIRDTFRKLRELKEEIDSKNYKGLSMDYLSMGMTNDYEIAIEEGSNILRLGRVIFGERDYSKEI